MAEKSHRRKLRRNGGRNIIARENKCSEKENDLIVERHAYSKKKLEIGIVEFFNCSNSADF